LAPLGSSSSGAVSPNSLGPLAAGGDVAVLIGPADLQPAAVQPAELHEVERLEQHVGEFRVADPGFGLGARVHRVLGEHVVDGEMLAVVAQELEEADAAGPVGVVGHHGAGRRVVEGE
jgi:hypothetical protein